MFIIKTEVDVLFYIEKNIISEKLKNGDAIPSLKDMSYILSVSRNTVIKAYQKLSSEGILEYRRGIGYFCTINSSIIVREKYRCYLLENIDILHDYLVRLNIKTTDSAYNELNSRFISKSCDNL